MFLLVLCLLLALRVGLIRERDSALAKSKPEYKERVVELLAQLKKKKPRDPAVVSVVLQAGRMVTIPISHFLVCEGLGFTLDWTSPLIWSRKSTVVCFAGVLCKLALQSLVTHPVRGPARPRKTCRRYFARIVNILPRQAYDSTAFLPRCLGSVHILRHGYFVFLEGP